MKSTDLVRAPKSTTRRNTEPRVPQTLGLIASYNAMNDGDDVVVVEGFGKYNATTCADGIASSHITTFAKHTGAKVSRDTGVTADGNFFVVLTEPKPKSKK